MSILLTGGDGCNFIGTHLVSTLLENDETVVNLDGSSSLNFQNIHVTNPDKYHLVKKNIWDDDVDLVDMLNKYKIDSVMYVAPMTLNKDQTLIGFINLLEAVHQYGKIKRIVLISTGGSCPSLEMLLKSHGTTFGIDHIVVRSDQVYGPGQKTGSLIVDCLKGVLDNNLSFIHALGGEKRNFVYIDDFCDALCTVMRSVGVVEKYDVKGLDDLSVYEVFQKLIELTGTSSAKQEVATAISKDQKFDNVDLDDSNLRKLGWMPKTSWDNGIKKTIEWFQNSENHTTKPLWLVYGHNGWIGSKYCHYAENHVSVSRGAARADNVAAIQAEMDDVRPDHVVCIIGETHGPGCGTTDWLEQPGHLKHNVRDNLFGPVVLARECERRRIKMTYMGSGCIFNFTDEQTIFKEGDTPNFFGSSSSLVKGFTDQIAKMFPNTVLNCRIRMPMSSDRSPRNFITKITTYDKICSIPNSMTVLEEILPMMVDMGRKGITGTFNMTNPGLISHNEILEMYKSIVDPLFTWKNFSHDEMLKILAADRSNNELDNDKLLMFYPGLRPIKKAVADTLNDMKAIDSK